MASLSARIGQADADNIAALITARERLSAHLASGQATEDYYVGKINAFNPRKVPLMAVTLAALHVAGTITAPLEVPLTALSAPGVINAPLTGAKQVGAAALVLSKLPRALVGLGRAGNVAVQAERMVARGSNVASEVRLALPAPRGRNPDLSGGPMFGLELPRGFRFNQAVSPGQNSPGAFGTPHKIDRVQFVRDDLAVILDFKPVISGTRVVEVTRPVRAQLSSKRSVH